ncbi:hypothetical protein Scep_026251 [Stephania cephalantha]|uniref:Uncharacterized protein n=1 Tax=Stephania cephalantha TaxID=152367 RepID=A0AAP0HRW5_9MAGN
MDSAFVEAWKKLIPNIEPPKTPLSFMKAHSAPPLSHPSSSSTSFCLTNAKSPPKRLICFIVEQYLERFGYFVEQ